MYSHLSSPHRMSVPPPYAAHLEPSALAFVSKVLLGAIAVALGAALVVAAPQTVLVPIASVLALGVIASLAVVRLDRRISGRRPPRPGGSGPRAKSPSGRSQSLEPGEALGLASFALLLVAVVSSGGLRILLASAGLFGLGAFRLAAARAGWARRGLAWV